MKRILFALALILFLTPVVLANTVRLQWNRSTESDNAGYNVYRSITGVFIKVNAAVIPQTAAGVPVTYTDITPENRTYDYHVKSVNQAGIESPASNQVRANPLAPAAPTGLTITGLTTVNLWVDDTKVASGPILEPIHHVLEIPRITPPQPVLRDVKVTVE